MPEQVANDEGARRTDERAPDDDDDDDDATAVAFASRASPDGNDGRELSRMSADSGGGAAEAAAAAHTAVVFASRSCPDGNDGRDGAADADDAVVRVDRRGRVSYLR